MPFGLVQGIINHEYLDGHRLPDDTEIKTYFLVSDDVYFT